MKKRIKLSAQDIIDLIDLNDYIVEKHYTENDQKRILNKRFTDFHRNYLDENKNPTQYQLKSITDAVLTYWNEGTGIDVADFWEMAAQKQLSFEKKDYLAIVLKNKKIRNEVEYHFIVDGFVLLQQTGRISKEEATELKLMIKRYESKLR